MFGIKTRLRLVAARVRWRRDNLCNQTTLGRYPIGTSRISIGKYTYGVINVFTQDSNPQLKVGDFCSISEGVTFITCNDHSIDHLSTYPFKVKALHQGEPEAITKGGIVLGDDVWVGYGATILDGVTIGNGAVVGAGAVVTKDVDPYTIVGGVPAKLLRKRFDDKTISALLRFDWSHVDETWIKQHLNILYAPLDAEILDQLMADVEGNQFIS